MVLILTGPGVRSWEEFLESFGVQINQFGWKHKGRNFYLKFSETNFRAFFIRFDFRDFHSES